MALLNLFVFIMMVSAAAGLSITNDGYWTVVGSMSVSRSDLGVSTVGTAIILTGGCLGPQTATDPTQPCSFACQSFTNLTEAFFPANNSFVRLADMPRNRYRHSTEVINGLLYAIGGRDSQDNIMTTVDVYNFATNSWSTSSLTYSPNWNSDFSTFVYAGKIWLIGGYQQDYTISPGVATFSPTAGFVYNAITAMSDPRGDTCATESGSTIYVVGGFDPASGANFSTPVSTLEIFDFATNQWTYGAATPAPGGDKACGIMNGRLHVFGGEGKETTNLCVYSAPESNTEEYNLNTKQWTEEPPMDTPRFRFAAEYYSYNGSQTLYIFGGQGPRNGNSYPTLSSVEMFTDLPITQGATTGTNAVNTVTNGAASVVVGVFFTFALALTLLF